MFPEQEDRSLLHTAARNNNPVLLKLLLESGYTVDWTWTVGGWCCGWSLLEGEWCCGAGQSWASPGREETALTWAASAGSSAAAEFLIEAGADVDSQKGRDSWTPLH